MVNEIKGNTHSLIQNLAGNRQSGQVGARTDAGPDRKTSATGADSTEVRLTDTAEMLKMLKAEMDKQPVVDSARVNAIKQAIFDGSYNMDIERTADKMAGFEGLLNSRISSGK